jgi:CheY-like chemotaxis protein
MGGRIWVESEVGKGSVFHFTINMAEAKTEVPRTMQIAADALRDRRVLIIDDNETNRLILETTLQNWGTRTTQAASGGEALEIITEATRTGQNFDVILLDAQMPEMDGFEVARVIKQKGKTHRPAIMMLSSSYRSSDLERCEDLGIHAVLTKPIGQRDLLQAICSALPQADKTHAAPQANANPAAELSHDNRIRILVAEDNPINREVARGHLTKRGHLVVTVNDGEQAVAEWRKNIYDIILMDIQMPVMDGPTATRRIRAEEKIRGGRIPIVAMTAHALKGTEEECLSYGMDSYVSKPLNRERFIALVETLARPAAPSDVALAAESHPAESQPVAVAAASATHKSHGLIQFEKMAEHVGADPETQRHVVQLCLQAIAAKLPQFRVAMSADDETTLKRIAHYLRGSLGLLGLPELVKLGEDIEYRQEELGLAAWKECCGQFAGMLERIHGELQQVRAA